MDSDGDGITNGEELGDPNCNWEEREEPLRKRPITHPGQATLSANNNINTLFRNFDLRFKSVCKMQWMSE